VNPVAVITHVAAVAAGVWGGMTLMGAIAPDLPDDEVEAAVSAPADEVAPDAPESLLRAENLKPALAQLESQLGAGGILRLTMEPGSLKTVEGEGGFDASEVPAVGPERLAERIGQERPELRGLADIQYVELVQTEIGPEWYVQLVSTREGLSPPWTYGAPLDLGGLTVGGAPPEQIEP
jgi:hypothetical protein